MTTRIKSRVNSLEASGNSWPQSACLRTVLGMTSGAISLLWVCSIGSSWQAGTRSGIPRLLLQACVRVVSMIHPSGITRSIQRHGVKIPTIDSRRWKRLYKRSDTISGSPHLPRKGWILTLTQRQLMVTRVVLSRLIQLLIRVVSRLQPVQGLPRP